MVTILWRLAGSPEPSGTLEAYSDADSVADYARSAMAWAVENGILNGENGALMPDSPATRGQTAAFILRYSQSTEKEIGI
ncbi:MAG: S-layer homology domain-containing protein [Oscillospiraceae bacterium]